LQDSLGFGFDSSLRLTYLQIQDSSGNPVFKILNWGGGDALRLNAQSSGYAINATAVRDIDIKGKLQYVDTVIAGNLVYGYGAAAVTYYVRDTSNAAFVARTNVNVDYFGGGDAAQLNTSSGGYALFNAEENDTLIVTCNRAGYYFPPDTIIVDSTIFTDTVKGYALPIAAPGAANVCRAYMYVYDNSGNALRNAQLFAMPQNDNVQDTCNGTVIGKRLIVGKVSDSTGYTYVDLIQSDCLFRLGIDSLRYDIWVNWNNTKQWEYKNYYVPAQDSVRITKE